MLSLFINWDVSPEIFNLGGISIRYYGLLFALAFVFGYKIEEKMFKSEGLSMVWLDKLWIYVAITTVIGARLGHCLFYDWAYYSQHPLEIVLPFRWDPTFKFTGYQGLASHGAAVGIIVGLWYYSKKVSKRSVFWILDRAVIPIALAGFFIRMGNLMNSEIIGKIRRPYLIFRRIRFQRPEPKRDSRLLRRLAVHPGRTGGRPCKATLRRRDCRIDVIQFPSGRPDGFGRLLVLDLQRDLTPGKRTSPLGCFGQTAEVPPGRQSPGRARRPG